MAGPGKRDEVAGGVCALLLSCDACGIDESNISARNNEEKVRSARLSVGSLESIQYGYQSLPTLLKVKFAIRCPLRSGCWRAFIL